MKADEIKWIRKGLCEQATGLIGDVSESIEVIATKDKFNRDKMIYEMREELTKLIVINDRLKELESDIGNQGIK
jgi:hypothetical protein